MDAAIQEIFAKVRLLKVLDFHKCRVLTYEQQGWLQLICDRYLVALPDAREAIRSAVAPEISFLFFLFAKTMSLEAVRQRDGEKLLSGLVAMSIENGTLDWRDSMVMLVLLYHSAVKIQADAVQLLQRAAAISTPRTRSGLLEFSLRTPEYLSLAKFGFEEGTDSEGNFAYVPKYKMRPWKE